MLTVVDQVEADRPAGSTAIDERAASVAGAWNPATVALAADVVESGIWEDYGVASPEAWLTWKLGIARHRAAVLTSLARRRSELPVTFELFESGLLSVDQARLIVKYCPVDYDRSVAEFAVNATLYQLRRVLRDYSFPTAEQGAEADRAPAPRSFAAYFTEDGHYRLRLSTSAAEGGRIEAAMDQARARLMGNWSDGEPLPTAVDAFMTMVDSAAAGDESSSRRHRYRAMVHVEAETLAQWSRGGRPHLHLGPVVARTDLEEMLCDAEVSAVIKHLGRPVAVGRQRRTVPPWLHRLITDRDGGCRVCGMTRSLDVHHIVHWADGGPTEPSNLVTVCRRCHSSHHRGEITVSGDPQRLAGPDTTDGLTIVSANGQRLHRKPRPQPRARSQPRAPDGSDPDDRVRYRHPIGERLRWWCVDFEAERRPPDL